MLAPLAVLCAAALAAGCGASRRAPVPYPGAPSRPPAGEPAAAPAAASGDGIAALALSLRGIPYANGGSDPAGFDCSGLVLYVFGRAGLAMPRSVREQMAAGRKVDGEPQPGDLLFFAIDGKRVSHVGIATGPDSFVHAPSSRGVVRAERLSSPYWSRRFAGARRVAPGR